jgi:16S rRNA (guanine966-N2)-methyltransferase
MRVIGGRSRGRRLSARLPATVRPTSDRVRESIFDILGSRGGVVGLRVVDLFCGSGALGVEALSRGAASVTFVDSDPSALDAVRQNLGAVGLGEETVTLVRAELPLWLRSAGASSTFDLALCDPPYDFTRWSELLDALQAGTAVMESSTPVELAPGWVSTRERRYGGTLVTVARRNEAGS